jgi:HEAT repeat protein
LIAALGDFSSEVRTLAARALGELGLPRTVGPLMAALKDWHSDVRLAAMEALVKLGGASVEPLLEALKDERSTIRQGAAEALAKTGEARAVEPLVTMLWDADSDVRKAASAALERLGWQPMDAVERARDAVARREWNNVASFGRDAVEPLSEALRDKRLDIRRRAAEVLAALGWQPANAAQRLWFSLAFGKAKEAAAVGTEAVEPLLAVLASWDAEGRTTVAAVLGLIGDARAVGPLVELARDAEVAELAIQGLQRILEGGAATVTTDDLRAVAALKDKDVVQVRRRTSSHGGFIYLRDAPERVDCSSVKRLAKEALMSRANEA